LVKIETCNRQGQLLHDGESALLFPDRKSALDDIKRHLRQFDETGYDEDGGYWWGRSNRAPFQQIRFFIAVT